MGFIWKLLKPLATRIARRIIKAALDESVMMEFVVGMGDRLVASTENTLDNDVWAPMRARLTEQSKEGVDV